MPSFFFEKGKKFICKYIPLSESLFLRSFEIEKYGCEKKEINLFLVSKVEEMKRKVGNQRLYDEIEI